MSSKKFRIAVFASGSVSNAEEIFKYFERHPDIQVVLLMTNNPNAFAVQRAKNHGIKAVIFNREQYRDGQFIRQHLEDSGATHIVLAGFLWLIPAYLLESFPDRII